MNTRTHELKPTIPSSLRVHFENKEIVKTFWLQVKNSWNSLFFFTFRELVSCSKRTQHPFFWKYREFVTSCVDATNTSAASFFLISWVRAFICCKHNRMIFGTSLVFVTSWVRVLQTQPPVFWPEFVTSWVRLLQTKPPDFWHEFVTSLVRVLQTQPADFWHEFVTS